jgi:hypothetical protein
MSWNDRWFIAQESSGYTEISTPLVGLDNLVNDQDQHLAINDDGTILVSFS